MERARYPEAEERQPWLGPLLDTYHMVDGVIREDLAGRRDQVPCKSGCSACCKGGIVPVNNIEVSGIRWFVTEQLRHEKRKEIISLLKNFEPGQDRCPFLVNTTCGIYAVRPVGCRTFHVIGDACKPRWDITDIDVKNIYRAPNHKLKEAARPMLSTLGIHDPAEQSHKYDSGYLMNIVHPMRDLDWASYILDRIELQDLWTI